MAYRKLLITSRAPIVGLLALLIVVAGSGAIAAPRGEAFSAQPLALTGISSIVVRAADGAPLEPIEQYAEAHGIAVLSRAERLHAVELDASSTGIPLAISTMVLAPGAAYAEPVYDSFDTADTPADPLFARERPYLAAVHAPEAWDIEKGRPETVVAVLDTGVDLEHPDLQGRLWTNPGEIPGNNLDDDNNGCFDDVHGCAFVDSAIGSCRNAVDGNVDDDLGHGTFVAGVIAANGNNIGIVGVARNVTVMPVKVLDCGGRGVSVNLADGIVYAAQAGAKVLNISLGGPFDAVIVRDAIRTAMQDYGAILVAASGNTGKAGVAYPARYPEVLAVGAATYRDPDVRAKFSSYGPEVDVVAVGEKIMGTVPSESCVGLRFLPCIADNYAVADGTSFSAPQVAGLIALVVSRRPGITPAAITELVKSTADAVPPGDKPNWAGAGRINMLEALRPAFRLGAPALSKQ